MTNGISYAYMVNLVRFNEGQKLCIYIYDIYTYTYKIYIYVYI